MGYTIKEGSTSWTAKDHRMTPRAGTGQERRRGFNLIESAIVLAVVGAVLGVLWVTASAVRENYKIKKTVEDIFTTARNLQNALSIKDVASFSDGYVLNPFSIAAKAVPDDWIKKGSNFPVSPYGTNVVIANRGTPGSGLTRFSINFVVPKSVCPKIMIQVTAAGHRANKYYMSTGSGNLPGLASACIASKGCLYAPNQIPASPSAAVTLCNLSASPTTTDIQFYFGYTRIK